LVRNTRWRELSIRADFVAKLGFVVEEADETVYWLELIAAADINPGDESRRADPNS
jgi:hypothetical protein